MEISSTHSLVSSDREIIMMRFISKIFFKTYLSADEGMGDDDDEMTKEEEVLSRVSIKNDNLSLKII